MHLVTTSDGCAAELREGTAYPLFGVDGARLSMLQAIAEGPRGGATGFTIGGEGQRVEVNELSAPIPLPGAVIAAPVNYVDHMNEMSELRDIRSLGLFLKSRSSVTGPGSTVRLPYTDRRFDQEAELGVVIGKVAEDLGPAEALDYVFGYTCLLDITMRGGEDRSTRKSFRTFTPIGSWITTADEDPGRPQTLLAARSCSVSGVERQKALTSDLIWSVPELIAYASSVMTLYPGDVIASGTPQGVGPIVGGDTIAVSIERVGSLEVGVSDVGAVPCPTLGASSGGESRSAPRAIKPMTTRRFTSADSDLDLLYADVAEQDLQPLWLLDGLMTREPELGGAHVWRGKALRALMERSGELVTIDRGGDRRVLGLANPHLGGLPYATSTLWGAVQYLRPGEVAPAHRHSPGALRFVVEGSGVWTLVDGDAISMDAGDLVLTPPWTWHEHHNSGGSPMVWFDGLDLPLLRSLDAVFFEQGPDADVERLTPERSVSEGNFGVGAGLVPAGASSSRNYSPLYTYRRKETDDALTALVADARGAPAALRFVDPTTGRDVMATMRCEMHRIPARRSSEPSRVVGSSIIVCYEGSGEANVGTETFSLEPGDILAVPSWKSWSFSAESDTDLFRVSDAPVLEALGLDLPRLAPFRKAR